MSAATGFREAYAGLYFTSTCVHLEQERLVLPEGARLEVLLHLEGGEALRLSGSLLEALAVHIRLLLP